MPAPTPTLLSTRIATLALSTFSALPSKSKPRTHPSGLREWTPLSAIVLASSANSDSEILTCVSLATGTKCLPVSSIPKCNGTVLHDCHAEILALRGFNRWLLAEIERMLEGRYESKWLGWCESALDFESNHKNSKPFVLRPNVSIHLFSTEAPCGDASMGLLIGSKGEEDNEAWPEPAPETLSLSNSTPLHGRGYFSLLGTVRRKPSRADAEPTLSKSCTDKLALKQVTSVLAWPASLFVQRTSNAFLKSIVLPAEKYDAVGFERAFGPCRFSSGTVSVMGDEPLEAGAMRIHHFDIDILPADLDIESLGFAFAKPSTAIPKAKASNISALWVPSSYPSTISTSASLINETLLNGVKQGSRQFSAQDFKTSEVCRRRMWEAGKRVVGLLGRRLGQRTDQGKDEEEAYVSLVEEVLDAATYGAAKKGEGFDPLDHERRDAKEWAVQVTKGWVRNKGDEAWGLPRVEDVQCR
jgi:tRNA-specific adenosine deaminase 1